MTSAKYDFFFFCKSFYRYTPTYTFNLHIIMYINDFVNFFLGSTNISIKYKNEKFYNFVKKFFKTP